MTNKIAVIGFGNIAKAIITPLLDKNLLRPENVICIVNSKKSLEKIKESYKYKVNVFLSNSKDSKLVGECNVKLLCIKPQKLNEIAEFHNNNIKENLLI